jgi:hypothetical protein
MIYTTILTEIRGRVGLVTLNRPEAMNAFNHTLTRELMDALEAFDNDDAIGAMVVTGNQKAFAAGADIKEMADKTVQEMADNNFISQFGRIRIIRKPVIAAVSGWALGGGCEVAMSCDMIVASETAKFGQPEITIGVIPGAGGTQRLTRAVGKHPVCRGSTSVWPHQLHRPGGSVFGGSGETGRGDRVPRARRHPLGEEDGQPCLRTIPGRGPVRGKEGILRTVWHRGSKGRHARLRGKTQAAVEGKVIRMRKAERRRQG